MAKIFFSNDGSEFGGSIYQKVSENLETAINLNWVSGTNSTRFGIAAKYQLDPTASISVSKLIATPVLNSSLKEYLISTPTYKCSPLLIPL